MKKYIQNKIKSIKILMSWKTIFNFQSIDKYFKGEIGLFEKFLWGVGRTAKYTTILAVFIGTNYVSVRFASTLYPVEKTVYAEVDMSSKVFASKIDGLKDAVVDEIMNCESPGYKEADALVTYDPRKNETVPSNIPSFGRLQFKVATVVFYEKSLYSVTMTPKDAVVLALNVEQAHALAKDVMFKSKNKANDWKNCADKLGTNAKIDLIKQIEK